MKPIVSSARYVVLAAMCIVAIPTSIDGNTAGQIMTKFGTHVRIYMGMVPT